MRIVFVGPFGLRPKSTVRVRAVPIARALQRFGHEMLVVVPPLGDPAAAGTTVVLDGVTVVHSRLPRLRGWWYGPVFVDLLQRTFAFRPDVVHCFKPKGFPALVLLTLWLARRLAGTRRPRLVLDTDDWEGDGGWNDRERYSPVQRRVFAWQERWALRHADAVTVASRELGRIAGGLRRHADEVLYLPNGVDATRTAGDRARGRRTLGLADEPIVLLYTRFFEFDLARVVAIWADVIRRRPDARLLVVGQGLFGEETSFARLLEARGLARTALLTGWVEGDRLADLLAAADVAIYPMDDTALNRTKCPAKLVDLLAAGIPVIGEAVGQVAEYIQPGVSGVLVSPADQKAFAAAVLEILGDATKRHALGQAARARLLGAYQWERLIEPLDRLYRCR